jgi:hypothetical protein
MFQHLFFGVMGCAVALHPTNGTLENKTNRLCGHKLIKIFSLHRYKLICLAAAKRESEQDKRASEKITPEGREIYGFVTRLIAELFALKL